MTDPRRRSITGVLLATAVALASPAPAAQLHLEGPPGTRARVDGRDVGPLPLAGPITIEVGNHEVRFDLAGYHAQEFPLRIELPNTTTWVRYEPERINRGHALAYGLLVAGGGQRAVGRPRLGWTLTALEVAGIGAAIAGEAWFRSARSDWRDASTRYEEALNADEAAAAQQEVEAAYDDMGTAETLRNVGLYTIAGAIAIGTLDLVLRAPPSPAREAAQASRPGATSRWSVRPAFGREGSLGCAVRTRF